MVGKIFLLPPIEDLDCEFECESIFLRVYSCFLDSFGFEAVWVRVRNESLLMSSPRPPISPRYWLINLVVPFLSYGLILVFGISSSWDPIRTIFYSRVLLLTLGLTLGWRRLAFWINVSFGRIFDYEFSILIFWPTRSSMCLDYKMTSGPTITESREVFVLVWNVPSIPAATPAAPTI